MKQKTKKEISNQIDLSINFFGGIIFILILAGIFCLAELFLIIGFFPDYPLYLTTATTFLLTFFSLVVFPIWLNISKIYDKEK